MLQWSAYWLVHACFQPLMVSSTGGWQGATIPLPQTCKGRLHFDLQIFPRSAAAIALSAGTTTDGVGPIILENIQCSLTYVRLFDCPHHTNQGLCGHHQDVGARCDGNTLTDNYTAEH